MNMYFIVYIKYYNYKYQSISSVISFKIFNNINSNLRNKILTVKIYSQLNLGVFD